MYVSFYYQIIAINSFPLFLCLITIKIYFSLLVFPARSIDHTNFCQSIGNDNYSFVYVAHPRAVTHLSWRKTSKYMPK
jgi:predicted CDP-diglyceride synthetase/phosphatidate cytidylyltransferase